MNTNTTPKNSVKEHRDKSKKHVWVSLTPEQIKGLLNRNTAAMRIAHWQPERERHGLNPGEYGE